MSDEVIEKEYMDAGDVCETVTIEAGKGDYKVINADEFDEKTMKLYTEPKAKKDSE